MSNRRTLDQINADVARDHAAKTQRNNDMIDAMIDGRQSRTAAMIGDSDHSATRAVRDVARDGQHHAAVSLTGDAVKPNPIAVSAADMRDLARANQY
jgi:hypothetical protein